MCMAEKLFVLGYKYRSTVKHLSDLLDARSWVPIDCFAIAVMNVDICSFFGMR
jgi:hypothetical protein